MMKKAFVTGADGFLAQNLIELLLNKGYQITGLVNPKQSNNKIVNKIKIIVGDLKQINTFKNDIPKNCILFHCYSLSPGVHASKQIYYKENILSTKNILQSCQERKIKKMIYISSCSINSPTIAQQITEDMPPSPDSLYSKSKLTAEKLVKEFHKKTKIPCLVIRVPTIFGEGMHSKSSTTKFFKLMKNHFFIIVGKGEGFYEFSYIKNVVYGIVQSLKVNKGYNLFIVADTNKVSFKTVAETVAKYVNPKVKFIYLPFSIALLIGFFGNLLTKISGKRFPFRTRTAKNMAGGLVFNPTKAVKNFGLKQKYTLDQAIDQTVAWLKSEKML